MIRGFGSCVRVQSNRVRLGYHNTDAHTYYITARNSRSSYCETGEESQVARTYLDLNVIRVRSCSDGTNDVLPDRHPGFASINHCVHVPSNSFSFGS